MKQTLMFNFEDKDQPKKYTAKIEAPIYEPTGIRPHILSLCETGKTNRLLQAIDDSSLPSHEKSFLRLAASRHLVFNYESVANYYAHATKEMQQLMEDSALVIIDFDKAIEGGFVRLCDEIKTQFMEEYPDECPS